MAFCLYISYMKKQNLFLILFFFLGFYGFSQEKFISVLTNNRWFPESKSYYKNQWIEDDTIKLKSFKLKKSEFKNLNNEFSELSNSERLHIFKLTNYKEQIYFSSTKKIQHIKYITCTVGETMYTILDFSIINNTVEFNGEKYYWKNKKEEKENFSYVYTLGKWNNDEIVLFRKK